MAIEHKRLGKHGVVVSNPCLGTMNFGWHTDQQESFGIMDRASELAINFFDTADVYGWGGEPGDTEEILNRWFARAAGAGTPWSWPRRSLARSSARSTCQNRTQTRGAFQLTRIASTARAA